MSRTCVMNSSSDFPAPTAAPGGQAGALEVSDVTVRFAGLTALDGVSLTAAPRKVTGIIGPNGAGTTPLRTVLCGFVQPDGGRLRFDGSDLTRLRPHRLASLGIARTLQGVGLFPGLTVLENVMVGGTRHARAGFWSAVAGVGRSDRDEGALRDKALAALDRAGVPGMADRLPGQLSFAHRKRVALARALVAEPDRKSTRLNSSHLGISYAGFCVKKKHTGGYCRGQNRLRPIQGASIADRGLPPWRSARFLRAPRRLPRPPRGARAVRSALPDITA